MKVELFALVIALWVRSYSRWDAVMYSANDGHHYRARWIDSAEGLVGFFWSNGEKRFVRGQTYLAQQSACWVQARMTSLIHSVAFSFVF